MCTYNRLRLPQSQPRWEVHSKLDRETIPGEETRMNHA